MPSDCSRPALVQDGAPYQHRILTRLEELEALAPEWERLWRSDPDATPFQSPQWLIPWWKHVGEGELFTLTARDHRGRLAAVLPIYLYRQPTGGERHLLLLGAGTSDYLGGVFAQDSAADAPAGATCDRPAGEALSCAGAIARICLGELMRHARHWDRAVLHQLPQNSPLLAGARADATLLTESESCAGVSVTGLRGLPAKLQSNIGRYRRRAQTQGALRFSMAGSATEALRCLDELIDLHSRRWQQRGESGVLAPLTVQAHHRETVPALFRAGLLRMFRVSLDGVTMATLYAFVDPPRPATSQRPRSLLCYLIGFDTQFIELSPGTLVLSFAIEQCEREGLATMDMLRGGETYKRLWGAVPRQTFRFEVGGSA